MSASPPVRRLADWDGERLRRLAASYGTPLYVLDLERVRANYDRLAAAFPEADILYAAKANALGDVMSTLLDRGAGIECASAGEVERAIQAGADGSAIHYTAVNPPARDLEAVLAAWADNSGLTVTVGARDTLDRLVERDYDGRVCIRVNTGVGLGHHETVRTGADAAFGVPADEVLEVAEEAAASGLDVVGLHAHAGSGFGPDDLGEHRSFLERLGELARAAVDRVGPLELVDVGGGLGVPSRETDEPIDLEAVATATRETLGEIDATLTIEPGRYLVADAGVLLTTVTTVKHSVTPVITGVDAGMTTLIRPALYGAYHPVRSLAPDASARPSVQQTLSGPICEGADVLAEDRSIPASERGDLLAVGMTGAYGYEMASHYTSRPRPATVVLDDGDRLGRRRETVADILRPERFERDRPWREVSR